MVRPIYYFWLAFALVIFCFSVPYTYAAWPGECTVVVKTAYHVPEEAKSELTRNSNTVTVNEYGIPVLGSAVQSNNAYLWGFDLKSYYYENDGWNLQQSAHYSWGYYYVVGSIYDYGTFYDVLPDACPTCDDAETEAATACNGSANVIWDDHTPPACTYHCNSENQCDQTQKLKDINACPLSYIWYPDSCLVECQGIDQCTNAQVAAAMQVCGMAGVQFTDTTDPNCPYTCKTDCQDTYENARYTCGQYPVKMNYDTCDYSCDKCSTVSAACIDRCTAKGQNVYLNSCTTSSSGVQLADCKCTDEKPDDIWPDDPVPPTDPAPDPTDPDPTTNPNLATDILKGIKTNTDKQIGQNDSTNIYLKNIDNNQAKTVNNLDAINTNLQTSTGKVTDKLDSVIKAIEEGGGGGITDENIHDIGDEFGAALDDETDQLKDFMQGVAPSYDSSGMGTPQDMGARYTQMANTLKSTPIYGMITGMGNIPGGSSVQTISMGASHGGDQAFDWSDFGFAWTSLRAVLLILASWMGVKIVVLKKD